MKKLNIFLFVVAFFSASNCSSKILDISIFDYSNVLNDYKFHIYSFFTSGAPGACPKVKWKEVYKSNDTIYINALYDVRGMWPLMGCGASDYVFHTNTYSDVKYYTITSGYIKGPSATPEKDTLRNEFDTTFYIGPTSIKEQNEIKNLSIYPNPTSTVISLPISVNELLVYNIFGQVVVQEKEIIAQQSIPVHQLSSGLYFVAIFDKEKNKIGAGKFYKE